METIGNSKTSLSKKRKEECRSNYLGGSYLKSLAVKSYGTKGQPQAHSQTRTYLDTKSRVLSTSREPVTAYEPGAYPAIPVHEYRDEPLDEIAVHYVPLKCIVKKETTRNKQPEDKHAQLN